MGLASHTCAMAEGQPTMVNAPRDEGAHRVLVVDDDLSVLSCYARLLRRSGLEAVTLQDPRAALARAREWRDVSLILLDYRMPHMDGLTLLAELRRRECRARCILVSAYLNDELREQARLLGVDRVLEKPVDPGQLRAALADLLAGRDRA